jgi:hypothetical protein
MSDAVDSRNNDPSCMMLSGRHRVLCCGTFIERSDPPRALHVQAIRHAPASIAGMLTSLFWTRLYRVGTDTDRVSIAVVVFRGGASATHPRTRRRLGITVVQPVPVRSGPSPGEDLCPSEFDPNGTLPRSGDYESGHFELAGFGVLHRSIPRDCTVTRRYRYSASAARLAQCLLAHIRGLVTKPPHRPCTFLPVRPMAPSRWEN